MKIKDSAGFTKELREISKEEQQRTWKACLHVRNSVYREMDRLVKQHDKKVARLQFLCGILIITLIIFII